MSTPFQNRLVGTIIVAAVVIIFLPDVLDGKKKSYQMEFEAIPQAEVFSGKVTKKTFPEDKLVQQRDEPVSDENALDEIEPSTNTLTSKSKDDLEEQPIIEEAVVTVAKPPVVIESQQVDKLPEKAVAKEAWVIHLGSFKDKENVAQLLKKLKANGYIAFTKPIKTKKGTLTKVIIGPELIKASITKKLPALKDLTGIQGKVAYFEPNK